MKFFSWKNLRGFSLVEVLVAVSIFSVVAVVSTSIFIEVSSMERKSAVQNIIFDDAQSIMRQITQEIQAGTIDYEEYYSVKVAQRKEEQVYYGINYGAYSSRFYSPGSSLDTATPKNPDNLGVECSYIEGSSLDNCEVRYTLSSDRNTGKNPFDGSAEQVAAEQSNGADSNAFCDLGYGKCDEDLGPINQVEELYIIDSTGTKKTILARKVGLTSGDWVLGMVKMDGKDLDQNGVIDTFICKEEFNCLGESDDELGTLLTLLDPLPFIDSTDDISTFGIRLPQQSDLEVALDFNTTQFVAISPLRSTIKNLQFTITPVEDPYKGYAETDMQMQPSVTITLTLGLSASGLAEYPGDFPDITLQTTVAAGSPGKINAYPPTNDLEWLQQNGLIPKTGA